MSEYESAGQPTKYREEYCKEIVDWFTASNDWSSCPTFEKYSVCTNVASSTLRKWKNEHVEFSAAYKKCKNIQIAIMIEAGLTGEFKGPFTMYAMGNMFGWSQKTETDLKVSSVQPLEDYLKSKKDSA